MNTNAIEVKNLCKSYGSTIAVSNVSFEVKRGEIFGMVGPNGAGKTTTIEMIEGLRKPDKGSVMILGLNPFQNRYELSERIGVQLQATSIFKKIKVRETLELFASFYQSSLAVHSILEMLSLQEKADSYFNDLSGGLKQRVALATALINDPEVLFLDELTTGLDPQARHAMWNMLRQMRSKGKTVMLTTHYMEEAEHLCDRVAIIDHGCIIALDTPRSLITSLAVDTKIVIRGNGLSEDKWLKAMVNVHRIEHIADQVIIYTKNTGNVLHDLTHAKPSSWNIEDLHVEKVTLEDVFLTLTGREMRE